MPAVFQRALEKLFWYIVFEPTSKEMTLTWLRFWKVSFAAEAKKPILIANLHAQINCNQQNTHFDSDQICNFQIFHRHEKKKPTQWLSQCASIQSLSLLLLSTDPSNYPMNVVVTKTQTHSHIPTTLSNGKLAFQNVLLQPILVQEAGPTNNMVSIYSDGWKWRISGADSSRLLIP